MFPRQSVSRFAVVFAFAAVFMAAASAYSQTPAATPVSTAAQQPRPNDLEAEITAVKAENAAVKEQLKTMEEQQKELQATVDSLQRGLGATGPAVQPTPSGGTEPVERYQDGIVLWKTKDTDRIQFLAKYNQDIQLRFLNTTNSVDSFTDHLGNVRDVQNRNDITVNRTMLVIGGYIFDKRLIYNFKVWTSAGAASIVVAGNLGWQFNKALTLMTGYTGVPGSRSLVNTFPYFAATDRTMADNFFRPGFTQGTWAMGELPKSFNYLAFVGNGLNTLNISATKIDTHLVTSGSLWWEPLGNYGASGKSRNMYDDYYSSKKIRIRIGTSFTHAREDRFSNLDVSVPENTSMYNSDGVLLFSTGAFAPGVTVNEATYKMSAIDAGIKWNGLAVNGQYYSRWISDFDADGPMPLTSTFDNGFELSAGHFVIPKKLNVFGRGSMVFGQFNNSWEYAGGVKWHFLPTERLWLSGELMRVHRAPYSGAFTPYTAGLDGWAPMIQAVLAF
jgi:hypothetical protein